jgi:drug/metabolite transporter (DMT)-like permease
MPYVSILIIFLIWGSSFILMDRALAALGPVEVAIARLLSGATVVGCYWYFSRQPARFTCVQWAHIGLVACLSNTLPFVIQPYLLGQGFGHSFFGTMVALVPLATILVSIPMLGIWPSRRQTVGVVGGFICVAALMHDGSIRGMSFGLLALAVSVPMSYAFGNTYIRWKLNDLPAEPLTALFLGLGGLMLVPLELMPDVLQQLHISRPATPHHWPLALAAIGLLGIVGTGMTILVFIRLIQRQGPLFAGMVTYIIPVIALLWGYVDGESISSQQMIAIAGVLAMVGLVQWGAAERVESPESRVQS